MIRHWLRVVVRYHKRYELRLQFLSATPEWAASVCGGRRVGARECAR